MINNSLPEYAFIRVCIFGLQAIAPVSVVYTAAQILLWPRAWRLPGVLHVWFIAEASFYLFFSIPFRTYLQKDAVHPPLKSKEERQELFRRVVTNTDTEKLKRHLEVWFKRGKFEDIGRDGMKSWLSWALWEGRNGEDEEEELEEYTLQLEDQLGERFPDGKSKAVPLRLTLDPIEMQHRSLLWYAIVGLVDFITFVRLRFSGYRFYRQSLGGFFTLFPFRPVALTTTRRSPAKHLTYWYRPHTSKQRLPIVFIHGIGIGLHPYVDFLRDLRHLSSDPEDGQVGILALELLPISFRLTHSIPPKEALLREIQCILTHHKINNFVLVTHSYGSVIATHILSSSTLSPQISSMLLIDPVTFLLHTPDVAFNFTVRKPQKANEWQLWYFASKDPGVAHTLGRHFHWGQNALWLDEELLPLMQGDRKLRVTVGLSARDLIVDTESVGRYLAAASDGGEGRGYGTIESSSSDGWKNRKWKGKGLEILWFEDTDHAQVFDTREKRERLVSVVERYCTGE